MQKQKKGNNKYKNIYIALIIFIIYFIWPYFLTSIFEMLKLDGTLALVLMLIMNFFVLGIIIYLLRNKIKSEMLIFKKNWKKNLLIGLGSLVVGVIIFSISNAIIYMSFPELENQNYITMSKMFSTLPVLLFISTIFYFPVIEELVFKMTFKDIIKNKWLFIIITGALNAFFQIALSSYTDSLVFIYLIPLSLMYMSFSYSYYKTDTIFTSLIFRMFYNLIPNIANLVVVGIITCL